MVEVRKPIPVDECVRKVMSYAQNGEIELVPIHNSYGRYLGEDLIATHHVPPFNRSAFDGFAIRSEDSNEASPMNPIEFEIIEEVGAQTVAKSEIQPFQAVRVMTGASIPAGCDTVVALELTKEFERDGRKYMSIKRLFEKGNNVSFEGEDTKKGTIVVKKGTKINPGVQALLATFGYDYVTVAKKPVIGVFATGSELLEVNEPLQPGKIRNSNAYMICGQIERAGATAKYFGTLPDNLERCISEIEKRIEEVDLLITTGGVSVGDYDYLPAIYEHFGADVLFNKVAMRPGSVTTVAQLEGKILFGLSGNPSACYVGFELFVRPVVRKMVLSEKPHLKKTTATLMEDFTKANPFTRFVRSHLTYEENGLSVKPSGFNKSNAVSSLADANVLMVLPGGTRGFRKGDLVEVLFLEDDEGSVWPWD